MSLQGPRPDSHQGLTSRSLEPSPPWTSTRVDGPHCVRLAMLLLLTVPPRHVLWVHFADKKTEAQRGQVACQSPHSSYSATAGKLWFVCPLLP